MNKGIKNALLNSTFHGVIGANKPYTEDTLPQYFADDTRDFMLSQMRWATDNVKARIQGLTEENFYEYTDVILRSSNVINPTTGRILNDDWQRIYVQDKRFAYLSRGAKVEFNGNTWLVVNPKNAQAVAGTAIIRRCNATWCHLSPDNEILKEPFIFGDGAWDLATGNWSRDNMMNMDGYNHAIMQKNPETKDLAQNERFLLGNQSYTVRGVVNFIQDFTLDENSTHIIYFDMDVAEPLHANDDEVNHIANGKWRLESTPVPPAPVLNGLAWVKEPPEIVTAYRPVTFEAGVFEQGKLTEQKVSYSFSLTDPSLYSKTEKDNQMTLTSYRVSRDPLLITVLSDTETIEKRITLASY